MDISSINRLGFPLSQNTVALNIAGVSPGSGTQGTQNNVSQPAADGLTKAQTNDSPASTTAKNQVQSNPGYAFSQDKQGYSIMKVYNTSGTVIYQVPTQGALELVELENNTVNLNAKG